MLKRASSSSSTQGNGSPVNSSKTNFNFTTNTTEQKGAEYTLHIALLGNVSVGKTTVLNALFRDRYGEMSKKRCTAGINFFHLNQEISVGDEEQEDAAGASGSSGASSSSATSSNRCSTPSSRTTKQAKNVAKKRADMKNGDSRQYHGDLVCIEELETQLMAAEASVVHEKIKKMNHELRETASVEEKHFNVDLRESLVSIHPDFMTAEGGSKLSLVFIDVPGLNESNSLDKMYQDYVREVCSWSSCSGNNLPLNKSRCFTT